MTARQFAMHGMLAALLAGCAQEAPAPPERAAAGNNSRIKPLPVPPPSADRPGKAAVTVAPLLGEKVVRAEWDKAANRATCAPLALKSDADAGGTPRPADFAGGWAVAFDQPDRRSAYGVAGVGALPDDKLDFAVLVDRLARQWPYV